MIECPDWLETVAHEEIEEESIAEACCICGTFVSRPEQVLESRPSGELCEEEVWLYCLSCWFHMEELRKKDVPMKTLIRAVDLSAHYGHLIS